MNMAKTRIEQKLEEWFQRGLALERQGLDPGVIGSTARFERQRARNRKVKFYRDLAVRVGKNKLKIAVVDQPEGPSDHVSLAVLLDLPLEAGGGRKGVGEEAIAALEAFVRDAVAELIKRHGGRTRKATNGSHRVKPA
jgi:hypothetical protein